MYRLLIYFLLAILAQSFVLSLFHLMPFQAVALVASTLFLVFTCGFVNDIFAYVFRAPKNHESATITALILALIVNPPHTTHDFIFLGWVAVLSMASKYILAINKKHIFNPVAVAVVLTAFGFSQAASWWVGNVWLTPTVVVGGYLLIRKIKREDLILSLIATTALATLILALIFGNNPAAVIYKLFFQSSLLFFAFVMLSEPLTTPPTSRLRIFYGFLTGILFIPQVHIGSIFSTPELALCMANIYSFAISPKEKFLLYLKEKIPLTKDTFDFVFPLEKQFAYLPGQFMEFTLEHKKPDDRGSRRYFTLASSPTERDLRIGVKFYDRSSSYKQELSKLSAQKAIVAASLAGDFVLPHNPNGKYVFMAGGIGITPFRSMLKYLIDTKRAMDIILIYSNKTIDEIAYLDVLEDAKKIVGLQVHFVLTEAEQVPPDLKGSVGRIDESFIKYEITDYKNRTYYISGPHAMVAAYKATLERCHIPQLQIKTDYFPGFA